jgi:hypothetical protein
LKDSDIYNTGLVKDTDTKLLGFQAGSDDEGEDRRKRRDFHDRDFKSSEFTSR